MESKVALITGASSGIGKATALQLMADGYAVYGAARRIENMRTEEERGMHVLRMDITNDRTMTEGINRLIEEQGRIDVLVNNAGYGSFGAIEDVSLDEARRQFEVNLFGLARLTQLVLPFMRNQRSGAIVNISSIGGKIYFPLGGWYHATKHALEGFSDCLRFETKPFGIKVIIIEPGMIRTEWDDVVGENLLQASGKGAYSMMAKQVSKAMRDQYQRDRISDPQVIAMTISEALKEKDPKTRYSAGYRAKSLLFFRKHFSDERFDRLLTTYYSKY